jgi:hypothetical protein
MSCDRGRFEKGFFSVSFLTVSVSAPFYTKHKTHPYFLNNRIYISLQVFFDRLVQRCASKFLTDLQMSLLYHQIIMFSTIRRSNTWVYSYCSNIVNNMERAPLPKLSTATVDSKDIEESTDMILRLLYKDRIHLDEKTSKCWTSDDGTRAHNSFDLRLEP